MGTSATSRIEVRERLELEVGPEVGHRLVAARLARDRTDLDLASERGFLALVVVADVLRVGDARTG